jgi:hypothetical protein
MAVQITLQEMVDNIRAYYGIATPMQRVFGVAWYSQARREAQIIASATGIAYDVVVGVVAALSPMNKWDSNILNAATYAGAYASGADKPKASTFSRNQIKAWEILKTADVLSILRGRKVVNFYHNIMGYGRGVTVDVWAIRAATNFLLNKVPGKAMYSQAELAYQLVADELGLQPCYLQAIVWLVVREGGRI